jgi:hypothetical protein
MIKQIELFDSVMAEHNLTVAQDNYDSLVPLAWAEGVLDHHQLKALDYLNHQKDRWEFIQAQEKALNDLLQSGYSVVACYSMGDGMRGCHLVLYKPDRGEANP